MATSYHGRIVIGHNRSSHPVQMQTQAVFHLGIPNQTRRIIATVRNAGPESYMGMPNSTRRIIATIRGAVPVWYLRILGEVEIMGGPMTDLGYLDSWSLSSIDMIKKNDGGEV